MAKRKHMPNNKHKGLFIYCHVCKKHFSWTRKTVLRNTKKVKEEPTCGETGKNYSTCKNFEKHRYKSRLHVPGSDGRKASKTHDATNYADAVIQAIDFEKEFKAELLGLGQPTEIKNRQYLFDIQLRYIDFLDNIDVPEHQKNTLSDQRKNEIVNCLKIFNEALTKHNINKKLLVINRIGDMYVGLFHDYLLIDKNYRGATYNGKMTAVKKFFIWAIDKYTINMKNPFEKVRLLPVAVRRDTITKEEFKNLLKIIKPENGIEIKGKYKRNRYKLYLKDALELALHTGGRREEVVGLKWNMIREKDGEPIYIEVPNLKVKRKKGTRFDIDVPPKIIPVTKSLKMILFRLGYNMNKGKDRHLLNPDKRTASSTKSMNEALSLGFSHFYNQLNTGRELKFKCLRKTYLTYLSSTLKGDAKRLSSHATDTVLKKHYIDERIVDKAIKELDIFED